MPTRRSSQAAHVSTATYYCPYQSHAPFGPNCAIGDVGPNGALVMSSTQDIYNSRDMLAEVLGLPVDKVRVQYVEGSGTYGRSCYEDAAQAAAVMSQAVGKPVRVQFMRSDEHGWDDYGPAHLADVRAAIDANGKIVAYEYHGWQHGWMINETTHELVLNTPPKERTTGAGSIPVNRMSTGSMYQVADRRVVSHMVPMVGLLKGAPLRSPLDSSFAFASEQTIDELAVAAKMDPLEFRRKNIGDARWLGVLNAAAQAAAWTPKISGSALGSGDVVTGRGIGVGTHHVSYGAAVAEIEVNKRTGVIVAKRLFGALDAGQIVNPAAVEAQIMGQMIQATSRTLKEEVLFDKEGVTSLDWMSYPVLRFGEHPEVVPVVVQRLDEPSSGAGEEVMGATTAAIANAFYDATGVRLRQFPMTPDRVKAALARRQRTARRSTTFATRCCAGRAAATRICASSTRPPSPTRRFGRCCRARACRSSATPRSSTRCATPLSRPATRNRRIGSPSAGRWRPCSTSSRTAIRSASPRRPLRNPFPPRNSTASPRRAPAICSDLMPGTISSRAMRRST